MNSYTKHEGYVKGERQYNSGTKKAYYGQKNQHNSDRRPRRQDPTIPEIPFSLLLTLNGESVRVENKSAPLELKRALDCLCEKAGLADHMALVFRIRVLLDLKAKNSPLCDTVTLDRLLAKYREIHLS